MSQRLIIHNSVSLDCSLTGFMPDMELHYRLASYFNPDVHLIGSETILKGIELFGETIPAETEKDFEPPANRSTGLPWWVIVDSGGKLKGALHTCRRFEYCRDVIVLISKTTPEHYVTYLKERNYQFLVTGKEKVELKTAFRQLGKKFNVEVILTDTGRILGNIILNKSLATEVSLIINPLIVGEKGYPMFSDINKNTKLKLEKTEVFPNGCIWMVYRLDT
jgi:2,5-diamino-6-(ribosylamino)-4(3H)-pyrimidinone 5'-phosphate reductase